MFRLQTKWLTGAGLDIHQGKVPYIWLQQQMQQRCGLISLMSYGTGARQNLTQEVLKILCSPLPAGFFEQERDKITYFWQK